ESRQANRSSARRCPPAAPLRRSKSVRVEPFSPSPAIGGEIRLYSRRHVGSRRLSGAGRVHTIIDSCRKTTLSGDDGGDLPTRKQASGGGSKRQRRDIVEHGSGETV